MNDLILNDQVRLQLSSLLDNPPHALLIVGQSGIGKLTIATKWASTFGPLTEVVGPDEKGTISIDSVRSLYKSTRAKHNNHQVVVMDHAEAMGVDAQNALLKLLEEPRSGVTFVLTAPNADALLPTITSRVQTVQIPPVADSVLTAWAKTIKPQIAEHELAQSLFIAQGRPATFKTMLVEKQGLNEHKQIMQNAKRLLSAGKYERLTLISGLAKDKLTLVSTLEAMAQMLKLQISKSPDTKWLKLADGLQDCLSRLDKNGNPRAQLLRLFMLY